VKKDNNMNWNATHIFQLPQTDKHVLIYKTYTHYTLKGNAFIHDKVMIDSGKVLVNRFSWSITM